MFISIFIDFPELSLSIKLLFISGEFSKSEIVFDKESIIVKKSEAGSFSDVVSSDIVVVFS